MEMHDSDDCLRSLLDDAVLQRADTLGGIYITSGNCLELCRFIKTEVEAFVGKMEKVFGPRCCTVLDVRPEGAAVVLATEGEA